MLLTEVLNAHVTHFTSYSCHHYSDTLFQICVSSYKDPVQVQDIKVKYKKYKNLNNKNARSKYERM